MRVAGGMHPHISASMMHRPSVLVPAAFQFMRRGLSSSSTRAYEVVRKEGRGRGVYSKVRLRKGQQALMSAPLVAVSDPIDSSICCQQCFRPVSGSGPSVIVCASCRVSYCSESCKKQHWDEVHETLCGSSAELDAYCREKRLNFPRVAAAMLAKSFSGPSFLDYWTDVNDLITLTVSPDMDAVPPSWKESYGLVRKTLSSKMSSGADAFFDTAFDLRTYARLMGTLRLNSFNVRCPLEDSEAAGAGGGGSYGGGMEKGTMLQASAVAVPLATSPSSPSDSSSGSASCGSSVNASEGGTGGCGTSSNSSCDPSGCGSSRDTLDVAEARGGTALFPTPLSLINHDCEPNCSLMMGHFAEATLIANRDIAVGEELTIAYMDDASTVDRRRRLQYAYGFECVCQRCTRELERSTTS